MNTKLNSFVVADPGKCIGCRVCEVACATAHSDKEVMTAGMMDAPVIPRLFLVKTDEVTMPVQCRQCEDAPCANVCPVSALRQIDNKIVLDEAACIGCKTCMMACPFGAIDLAPQYRNGEVVMQAVLMEETEDGWTEKEMVIASKCDMCVGRANGPACMEACPEKAIGVITPKKEKKRRNVEAAVSMLETVKKFIG